jgi:hypothetical protein
MMPPDGDLNTALPVFLVFSVLSLFEVVIRIIGVATPPLRS